MHQLIEVPALLIAGGLLVVVFQKPVLGFLFKVRTDLKQVDQNVKQARTDLKKGL